MNSAAKAILSLFSFAPLGVALLLDRDLSSAAHIAVIGVAATAVALCDALFGQIVALTGDMPFRKGATPAEAAADIRRFDGYHRKVFWAWTVAKLASTFAIMLPAVALAMRHGHLAGEIRKCALGGGYVALGVSLSAAVFFLASYWNARSAANKFRLEEITRSYKAEHIGRSPQSAASSAEEELRQIKVMSAYDSPPVETVVPPSRKRQ